MAFTSSRIRVAALLLSPFLALTRAGRTTEEIFSGPLDSPAGGQAMLQVPGRSSGAGAQAGGKNSSTEKDAALRNTLLRSSLGSILPLWYPFADGKSNISKLSSTKMEASTRTLCKGVTPLFGTMKSSNKLEAVMFSVDEIHEKNFAGDLVEAGVAQGGGVLPALFYLACTGDLSNRKLYLFDTWEGLPPPTQEEDSGFKQGQYHISFQGFMDNANEYGKVYDEKVANDAFMKTTAIPNWQAVWSHVVIVKGLFADTMPGALSGRQLALLMCDGDMYASTKDCMSAAAHLVVKGGVIYNDDYYTFKGCYDAVHEYLLDKALGHMSMQLVPQQGEFKMLPESSSHCNPPVDNSPQSGTCNGKPVEGGLFIMAS